MEDLDGRIAVVTGGGSGIGRAIAGELAARGMRVVVADIEEPALHETVAAIGVAGGSASAAICDVSSWESVLALREQARAVYGAADVVCNNAGVAGSGLVAEAGLNTWEWCLGVNLWGVIHGCKAFLPAMIERGSGHVVNTASVLGHFCSTGMAPYTVSKHGVVALSETLYYEMLEAGTGVGVSCLCPGFVATNIIDSERNRPERLLDQTPLDDGLSKPPASDPESSSPGAAGDSSGPDSRAAIRELYAQSMDPSIVAGQVVEAIRTDRLHVFTDDLFDDLIAGRHQDISTRRTPMLRPHMLSRLLEESV